MGLDVYTSSGARLTSPQLPTYVTSLPSGPIDGQEVYYAADATNGVIWHLRYRAASSSSYKWEFVGGPPLTARNDTTVSTSSTAFVSLTPSSGSDPTITTPLAGDYDVELGSYSGSDNTNGAALVAFRVGTGSEQGITTANYFGTVGIGYSFPCTFTRATGVAASTSINLRYRSNYTGTSYFINRVLVVRPVRVG